MHIASLNAKSPGDTSINKSEFFQEIKNNYEVSQRENLNLKEQLANSNNIIKDLSKKLQVSLNKYEELKNKKVSFWQRLKVFFNRQKSISDGKN